MANFQTIAAMIFKKTGIVAMSFVVSGAFDVSSPCLDDDLSQPVDLAGTVRPEGDPALVGDMQWRLGNTKKLGSTASVGRLELQPTLNPNVTCESQRGQEFFVKGPRLGQAAYSQIDVVVQPTHEWPLQQRDYSRTVVSDKY